MYLSDKIRDYRFPLFWIGLMISVYKGYSQIFLVAVSLILLIINFRKKILINKKIDFISFKAFVLYYIIVSIIGIFTQHVSIIKFIDLLIKYCLLPIIIMNLISNQQDAQIRILDIMKKIIFLFAIYGIIESYFKFNYMIYFVNLSSKSWMISMNDNSIYQPSSVFLHYSYYGLILVFGLILAKFIPFKNKIINIIYYSLLISQIILCRSRISWISTIVIMFIGFFTNKKIFTNKIRNIILFVTLFLLVIVIYPNFVYKIKSIVSSRFEDIFKYGFEYGSLGQRVGTLFNWIEYFKSNPVNGIIGTGYQSVFDDFLNNYSYFNNYSTPDNQLTVYLVETGVIGTLILINTLIKYFKIKDNDNENIKTLLILSKLSLVMFLIESMTLDLSSNYVIFSIIVTIIVIMYKISCLSFIKNQKRNV